MTDFPEDYSSRPQYYLRLRVTGDAVAGLSWVLDAVSKSGYGSFTTDAAPWRVDIGNVGWAGSAPLDFRPDSSGKTIRIGSGIRTSNLVAGNTYPVSASHGPLATFGSSSPSGSYKAVGVPPAPTMMYIDQITASSMRFDFDNNGDGGSPISTWQYQYATNSAFTENAILRSTGTGTNTLRDLQPGTTYWIRARGINAKGTGPWSSSMNATTLSGAYVSTGSAWGPSEVFVSTGSAWVAAVVNVSTGSAWVPAQ